jgi:hypothetical protein
MMMRRLLPWLALLVLVLSACGRSGRDFVWRQIDTRVAVQADGVLAVTETMTLGYTGGPFTFAYRDLPDRRLDGITSISVSDGEQTYQQVDDEESEQPYTFSVFSDDGVQRVRWVYPATSGGERTFVLSYQVQGAVRRYDDADEVWWTVVFGDRDEVVEQASGSIVLPEPVAVNQLDVTAPDSQGTVELAPGEALVRASNIAPDEELTLRARFPKGVVGGAAPAWQAAQEQRDSYNATARPTVNLVLSILSAGLAVLLAALVWGWWRRSRDPRPLTFAEGELLAPPDDLSPALAAKLTGGADLQAMLATLYDLANRGYLVFRERLGGWNGKSKEVAIARGERSPSDLEGADQVAYESLFRESDEVVLDSSAKALSSAPPKIGTLATQALIERGLLDRAALDRRRGGIATGVALTIMGTIFLIPALLLAERISWWLPVVAAVVLVFGILWLLLGAAVNGLTQAGADARQRWRAFQRYLKRSEPRPTADGQFGELLPYAIAIGDAAALTKAYAATAEPLPIWYYPILFRNASAGDGAGAIPGGAGSMSGGLLLQDFSQNFITSLSSAGGGASGGASAGGGASGGGGGGAG